MLLKYANNPLLQLISLILFLQPTNQQVLQCCGSKLLDSKNNVAIETGRTLTPGVYGALVIKVCTTETVQVQVWSGVSGGEYILKWFTTINPSPFQITAAGIIVQITNSALSITSNDRLALYSPGNTYSKIPVPYTYSKTSSIKLSSRSFNFPFNIPLGQSVNLKSTAWPRSFENSLKLCTTQNSCPSLEVKENIAPAISFSKYISMPATCCDPDRLPSCDITNRTLVILNDQTNIINVLINRISYLKILVENYIKGVNELGYCEDSSYTKGLYGLGHCYKVFKQSVELAEAAIICSADKARLVFIKDQFEDNFVRSMLLNNFATSDADSVKSWVAAIYGYEMDKRSWYWYNNLLPGDTFDSFGTYVKWRRGFTPVPDNRNDVCASYALNLRTNTYFWEKEGCTSKYPFICKSRKLCY